MDEIDLVIPARATTSLPNVDQIREIQSLVTQKLIDFNCLPIEKAPLYGLKIKVTLNETP